MSYLFLKSRVYSVQPKYTHLSPVNESVRYGQYKLWSEEQMAHALNDVINHGFSVRRAAMEHNVPKSTLGDRVSGRIKPGAVSGPAKYLEDTEEQDLVQFLLRCSTIGYAKTRKQVIALIQRINESRGIYRTVSDGWWTSFTK